MQPPLDAVALLTERADAAGPEWCATRATSRAGNPLRFRCRARPSLRHDLGAVRFDHSPVGGDIRRGRVQEMVQFPAGFGRLVLGAVDLNLVFAAVDEP